MVVSPDEKSAFKLAQLKAVPIKSHIQVFEKILKKEGDINFAIPAESLYKTSRPYNTALHYACVMDSIELFTCLLSHGADYTRKNCNGQTVLQMLIAKQKDIKAPLDNPFINAVLSAHVNTNNCLNPENEDGLTHFHIACMTNHSVALQFFLDNGVSVDQAVSINSKSSPGFTPLHFAATCTNTSIAQLLIAHGANMHVTDARSMTPLHLLVERRLQMYEKTVSSKRLQEQIGENEKIINILMENTSSDHDSVDSIGLSNFHVACLLQDTSVAQQLVDRVADLDHCVNMDSQLWPGFTALHFAAHISLDRVEMLIEKGANIAAQDSKGLTALDICIERYKIQDIFGMKSLKAKYKNLAFSDGRTKVLSLIDAMTDISHFKKFILDPACPLKNPNAQIPMNSPLWPGFTPLHLAVLFADRSKPLFLGDREVEIRDYFTLGADLAVQDSRGRTALHLAFRLDKPTTVDAILHYCKRIPAVADEDNLTHVHVVCATNASMDTLKKCVLDDNSANAAYRGTSPINNVRPGSSPLHVCLVNTENLDNVKDKIRVLLKSGADVNAKDARGLTPVHRILEYSSTFKYEEATKQLITKVTKDCVAEECNLSYLHVACHMDNLPAVKRLIKSKANVNLAIKCSQKSDDDSLAFLSSYDKCTPLHIARLCTDEINRLLMERGADVFAARADGKTALDWGPNLSRFLSSIRSSEDLQRRMRRDLGWTNLHFLCHSLVVDGFERSIGGHLADVNARVHANSPIWKGYTPLHLTVYRGQNFYKAADKGYEMSRVLLEKGADVTVMDNEGNTPITMMFKNLANDDARKQAALLMRFHRDFNVNPVGLQGISHFHIACYLNDAIAVEGFLRHGADVNHPINYFSKWNPGYTPLHLASQLRVVDLLIEHGADIHTEDVDGRNALSEAISRDSFDEDVVKRIIELRADVNGTNSRGQTPFEIAISRSPMTMDKLKFCIERGFVVNSCNPISGVGYIATILEDYKYPDKDVQMNVVETIMRENCTALFGRGNVHHVVAGNNWSRISIDDCVSLFEKLTKSGCDVDEQDDKGKTALHLAVEFSNQKAVFGLLACGADINILDATGKPALSYAPTRYTPTSDEREREGVRIIRGVLSEYAWELNYLKLDLCQMNADVAVSLRNFTCGRSFQRQIVSTQSIKLGVRSLRLHDFLTETRAIMIYPKLSESERREIEKFFETIVNDAKVSEIKDILKLQYRKAVNRIKLLCSATSSFRLLLGFDLPDLCADNIFQYLRNSELSNIVSAEIGREDMRMDVE